MKKIVIIFLLMFGSLSCSQEEPKTPQELIIGKWELIDVSEDNKMREKHLGEGYAIEAQYYEFYLSGRGKLTTHYIEPTKRSKNPFIWEFELVFDYENQFRVVNKDTPGIVVTEIYEIVEFDKNTLVLQPLTEIVNAEETSLTKFSPAKYKRLK